MGRGLRNVLIVGPVKSVEHVVFYAHHTIFKDNYFRILATSASSGCVRNFYAWQSFRRQYFA